MKKLNFTTCSFFKRYDYKLYTETWSSECRLNYISSCKGLNPSKTIISTLLKSLQLIKENSEFHIFFTYFNKLYTTVWSLTGRLNYTPKISRGSNLSKTVIADDLNL